MVDSALMTTMLVITLAGIGLVFLGGAAYVVYEAVQRRLDARAGVPAPGARRRPAAPSSPRAGARVGADAEGHETAGAAEARTRHHQPA
ncbi:hypothetical protein ACFPZ0_01015 [Streptomonospora nanhaiensis]|uniref:Uncharacterized protein n=1 Tax=Streptomonospora nanhaiensis TaxID=1323731 RepID=A0A853BFQ5_9ACTN|nr:hypothetical protein [Streptomonospora nanhaiensis]MBV2364601.1 hypothetical protein [Streptomonospora nanhaiensis]MBX9387522.1 hypothetical protein [Streptomonospora nanhaiensis]NYI94139.1 hypothetical protein [Streptomonospora nanhaiensis]